MGQIIGYKHGENSVNNVDDRLWDIVQNAIAAVPYDAVIRSGSERGKGDKGNHSGGYAVDVTLYDPQTGEAIPDTGKKGGASSAKIYEQYAQAARVYQQKKYPELDNTFRWGGGFRQGYPFDLMHLDITPGAKGAMAYYSWENGFNKSAYAALPGLKGQVTAGLGGMEGRRLVAQYEQALKGGPLPPADIPAPSPASLSPRLALARTSPAPSAPFAPETWVSAPKRPTDAQMQAIRAVPQASIPSAFDTPTPAQVADLYAGILPPPSASRPGSSADWFREPPIPTVAPPLPRPFGDSVMARINATKADLARPTASPFRPMVTGRPDAPVPSNTFPARTTVAGRPDAPISGNTFNALPGVRPPVPMPRSAANDARAGAGLWTGGDTGMGGLFGIPMASSIAPQGPAPEAREQSPFRDSGPVPASMSADLARSRVAAIPVPPAPRALVASNEPQFIPQTVRVPNPAFTAPSGMTFTPTGGLVTTDQRNAIAGLPPAPRPPVPATIPQYLNVTRMVPNPAYVAPVPAVRRQVAPIPATMSPQLSAARRYEAALYNSDGSRKDTGSEGATYAGTSSSGRSFNLDTSRWE